LQFDFKVICGALLNVASGTSELSLRNLTFLMESIICRIVTTAVSIY